ncbi:MAG: flagellar protein [Lachnospiraceae bacterium]|nr:flagellar protein [Lachnospiraceae bacterium]
MPNVQACRKCKRLFNAFGEALYCPQCMQESESKLVEVKDYLWDKKIASMHEISQACDVSIDQLKEWLREERLSLADGATELLCEKCGQPILTGRYCAECKDKMLTDLKSVTPKKEMKVVSVTKPARDRERMRFLDLH